MLSATYFVKIHLKELDDYITGITSNTINVNRFEKLAVDRFLNHKSKYLYKEKELIKALRFFKYRSVMKQCNVI